MAHFPSILSSSNLAYQLCDITLTPLLSSSRSPGRSSSQPDSRTQALTALTSTAVSAFDSASRLGLGVPQRIMLETQSPGPVVLHSYLNSQRQGRTSSSSGSRGIIEQAREDLRPLSGTTETENSSSERRESQLSGGETVVNGVLDAINPDEENPTGDCGDGSRTQISPLLIATVVAPSAADAGEARRQAASLERVGRDFQRLWTHEQSRVGQLEAIGTGQGDNG
ncbi:hypothetical protein G7Y89_g15042 [Cudoniella acicularis]|uniref:Uncharacterized protein n=1 Tax=Cudoniella acicularis TaxID=354080 RepID=A0A8H4QTW5_9HELO|nr:hypothetical protein G7Y89_g15042 [Cudoniella acicularis]